jgi:adenylate kinase family enzyme
MRKPILLMGLPGAGKTTLAKCPAPQMRAVRFNNDDVRAAVGRDLDFSIESRIEQARRMRWLYRQVTAAMARHRGRDLGYAIEWIDLDERLQNISGTEAHCKAGLRLAT